MNNSKSSLPHCRNLAKTWLRHKPNVTPGFVLVFKQVEDSFLVSQNSQPKVKEDRLLRRSQTFWSDQRKFWKCLSKPKGSLLHFNTPFCISALWLSTQFVVVRLVFPSSPVECFVAFFVNQVSIRPCFFIFPSRSNNSWRCPCYAFSLSGTNWAPALNAEISVTYVITALLTLLIES